MPTPDTCRTCGAPILWLWTRRHKRMPVNAESVTGPTEGFDPALGHVPHWARCPQRQLWKGRPRGWATEAPGLSPQPEDPTLPRTDHDGADPTPLA
jgi:hypothetical protein